MRIKEAVEATRIALARSITQSIFTVLHNLLTSRGSCVR